MDEYLKGIQERALNREEPITVHGSVTGRLPSASPPEGVAAETDHFDVVLQITVIREKPNSSRSRFAYTANYEGDIVNWGQGSSPYMAILDLINIYNPTIRVDKK